MYLSVFIYSVEGVGPINVRPIKMLGPKRFNCLSYLPVNVYICIPLCTLFGQDTSSALYADRARMAGRHQQPNLPSWYCSTFTNCTIKFSHRWKTHVVAQRFPFPVLCIFCMSRLVNTQLIQIASSVEESYVHELCSDWQAPYTVPIAPYFLSRENLLKFISLQNTHGFALHSIFTHRRNLREKSEVWHNIPL